MALDLEGINELSVRLEKESKALKDNLYRICWHMRGSISITEAYNLAPDDLEILNGIIKDNIDTTKKTGMPFF